MKVKELIAKLQEFDGEMEVFALNDEDDIYSTNKAEINHAAFNTCGNEKYGVLVGTANPRLLRLDWSHIKNVVTIGF